MPTTYYTTAKAGQPYKHNGATVLQAGNANTTARLAPVTNNLTLANNAVTGRGDIGTVPFLAVSPASSGNIGTKKAVSGGTFAQMELGQYVGMVIGVKIGGQSNTILRSPSNDGVKKQGFTLTPYFTYQVLGIASWSYTTGAASYNANRGSGVIFARDDAGFPTDAVPGEFTYLATGKVASSGRYQARTNP